MENNSSQLTERYKKEVADILRKISEGLCENILKKIEPEISNLNKKLSTINNELDAFKKDNITLHKSTEGIFLTELNLVKEDLKGNNIFFRKIEERSLNQGKIIEQISANGSTVNVLIEKVNKTLETIPENIRNLVTQLRQENSKITGDIQKSIDEILLKKIPIISEKLIQIESNSELKHQLKEMHLKQIRIFKFIYLLLFMLIAFFISVVSILVFQNNQIG